MVAGDPMSYTAEDILQQLDQSAAQFRFPGFNNANYHMGAARLSAFRNSQQWALIVEEVCWWPGAGGIVQNLSAFGNGLAGELAFPGQSDWQPGLVYWPYSSVECGFDQEGELSCEQIRIRGEEVCLNPQDLTLQPEVPERGFSILVQLVELYRNRLLCTPQELRKIVPPELELLIQLDQWCHPNVYLGELPGRNQSFRNLAEVLASGEVSRFRPADRPNVDWRLWMER